MTNLQIKSSVYSTRRPRWWQTIHPFLFWSGVLFLMVVIIGAGFVWATGI